MTSKMMKKFFWQYFVHKAFHSSKLIFEPSKDYPLCDQFNEIEINDIFKSKVFLQNNSIFVKSSEP